MSDIFARPVFQRVRRLCLMLPEAVEAIAWGHPVFRVGKKTFCAFELIKKRPTIAFRLPPDDVEAAIARGAVVTPYGRGIWASVRVDEALDWDAIARYADRSYRTVATKRQVASLDARRSG